MPHPWVGGAPHAELRLVVYWLARFSLVGALHTHGPYRLTACQGRRWPTANGPISGKCATRAFSNVGVAEHLAVGVFQRQPPPNQQEQVGAGCAHRRVALGMFVADDEAVVNDLEQPLPVAVGAMEVERTLRTRFVPVLDFQRSDQLVELADPVGSQVAIDRADIAVSVLGVPSGGTRVS